MLDQTAPETAFNPDALVVSETVEINAPASLVWEILIDMENYGNWNPFCVECSSTLEMGAPVNMKLKNYIIEGEFFENCEFVCANEKEKLLSWELPHYDEWPYPARRDQILEATGPESCKYHSTDAFLGPNGIHVMRFAGPWVKIAFDETAHALKTHAEKLYKQS
ncbi:MAG: SRPBCC domain-containing protein [Maricaulaceae bacterium]